ncbi:GntR family transcriptional regulator [Kushneria indalinina]|uniref:DNA-binding GntR family transcriptional regulator n=1 Tax=Kushneria indalinina DSM 14324 TaxID=1122140 RepID=A0A3D9DX54_9GAMM|nr:GntR family transcriptional regulator [Kushneria indalinina]REC95353.1 DNA-binding GntR family transcriptional regulator [Kushneria indalinina DSM 14324]
MSIKSLQRTTLRDQCLNGLRSAITSGQLPAGHHLVETELSEAFGVSRGTLREAMRRLEQEGLLVAGPRGQLRVREINEGEIGHLYQVRAALEVLAARSLCQHADFPDRLETLRECLARLHAVEGNLGEQIEADLSFHRTLCELSGNSVLLSSWLALEGPVRVTIMHAGIERALNNMSSSRHDHLLEVLSQRDPAHIERVLVEHMDEAAQRLMQAMETQSAG